MKVTHVLPKFKATPDRRVTQLFALLLTASEVKSLDGRVRIGRCVIDDADAILAGRHPLPRASRAYLTEDLQFRVALTAAGHCYTYAADFAETWGAKPFAAEVGSIDELRTLL